MKVNPVNNIPTSSSLPEAWIDWHKQLKSSFGKKQANALFIKAWSRRGSSAANTSDLRSYLSKNGINISKSAWDSVVDKGVDVTDFFGDAFTMGKYVSISLAVITLGGLALIIFNIGRKPAESIGTVIKYAK